MTDNISDDSKTLEVTIEAMLSSDNAAHGVSLDSADSDTGLISDTSDQKYAIGAELAKGGMGAVLNAKDVNIRRKVAMKVMLNRRQAPKDQVVRFIEEAQVTGQLEHPNIVPVHELSVDEDGNPYYTMKMIKGVTLKKIIEDIKEGEKKTIDAYPLGRLLQIFLQACNGVAYAHSKSVVHRDLKPENIMVGEYGEVLVVDWGLAKIISKSQSDNPADNDQELPSWIEEDIDSIRKADDAQKTMVGACMGTPAFMSPEQAKDASSVDALTDVYAMGGVLYNLLTLRPPVSGTSLIGVLMKVTQGEIEHPSVFNAESSSAANLKGWDVTKAKGKVILRHCPGNCIPASLTAVTMKALATSIHDRYQSVQDIQADVQSYLDGFATEAEDANLLTQLKLLAFRHKGLFCGLATALIFIIIVVSVAFANVKNEEQQTKLALEQSDANAKEAGDNLDLAKQALSKLKGTVPTFLDQAQVHVEKHEFDKALELIAVAIELDGTKAEAYCLQGHIYQTQLEFESAIDAYQQAMKLKKQYYEAWDNQKICKRLTKKRASQLDSSNEKFDLSVALREQGRIAEARFLLADLQADGPRQFAAWKPIFDSLKIDGTLKQGAAGRLNVSLDRSLDNLDLLAKLKGMPIGAINIPRNVADWAPLHGLDIWHIDAGDARTSSIAPLKGMHLRSLKLWRVRGVNDISALEGMSLEKLELVGTAVSDLTVLRGMPLVRLNVSSSPVIDLSPLRGMPLTTLDVSGTRVADITALKGLPLARLSLGKTKITNLTPLSGLPLVSLNLDETKISNLDAIKGLPLQSLSLYRASMLTDITAIEGMRLKHLNIANSGVRTIEILRHLPLETLAVNGAPIEDLTPLRENKSIRLINDKPVAQFWREYDAAQAAKAKE